MKRVLTILIVLAAVITLAAAPALAQTKKAEPAKKAEFKCEDPMGVIKIKKGDPIHIANWMVVAGPDASLGTDTKRGVEIAIDDVGGKVLGHPINRPSAGASLTSPYPKPRPLVKYQSE